MQEHRFTYPTVRPIWPNRSAAPAGATIAAHDRPRPGAAHDPLLRGPAEVRTAGHGMTGA